MTLKTIRNGMVLGAIAFLTIATAQAQSETVSVSIPFDYFAAGKILPAGEYTVQSGVANGVLVLRNRENGMSAMVTGSFVESNKPRADASLLFHRYGDRYFLSEIWTSPGSSYGLRLRPSNAEREQIAGLRTTVGLTARR